MYSTGIALKRAVLMIFISSYTFLLMNRCSISDGSDSTEMAGAEWSLKELH
jgi:hypothetical protein